MNKLLARKLHGAIRYRLSDEALNPRIKGEIIHKLLEELRDEIGNSQTLNCCVIAARFHQFKILGALVPELEKLLPATTYGSIPAGTIFTLPGVLDNPLRKTKQGVVRITDNKLVGHFNAWQVVQCAD